MALDEAGVQLIAQGVSAYISDINKADQSTTGFYKTLGSSDKSAGAFQEVITGALRHVGAALIEFGIQGAKAIGGFVKDSIGLAGEFESGMLNFQAVAGKEVDASGLEEFRDLFLDIGKRLPVSTSDVQAAAIEMVKGGIDPAIIAAGGLERNIQFAAAAMDGDLVKAAEISSKVLGGWTDANATAAQKTDFLTMATDLMAKAANASATDVEGLSRGIFNAQGIAKTAGVGFGDLTTTLALLAPRFASSSEAGNSLKNMIARLQPTTDPARDAMASLGLFTEETGSAFYDAAGNFVGFEQASGMLQESLKGLTKEQQASLLQQIFGNDAMSAAAALADGGAAAYANMAEAMNTANGVAETAALKQQGFETSLDNAKGSVEALQITIGSFLLPVLSDLLDNYIAPVVNAVTDLASTFFEAGGMSSEFGEAAGYLATKIGLPGEAIQDLVFTIQDLIGYFQAVIEDGDTLNDFFADLPPSIQPVVKIIGDLIAFFQDTSAASDDLGSALDDLNGVWTLALGVIEDVMGGYMAIAQAVLPVIQQFIADHGEEIETFFQATWDAIIDIITLALELYQSIVPPILHFIADFINDHGSEIQKILSGAWDMITSIITGALETIKGVLKLALDLIHGDWDAAWQDLLDIGKAQITAIQGAVTGFLDLIAGIFDTSLADILQTWADNWEMLVNIATETDWGQVGQDIVDGIIAGLAAAWSSLVSWIVGQMGSLVGDAIDAIDGGSPAMKFAPVGMSIVQGIMLGLENEWPSLTGMIGSISADLIDEMEAIGEEMNKAIASGFGATASIDRQIMKNLDRFDDVLPGFYTRYTTEALKQAQAEAEAMLDPAEGAKFFKMRSDQIFEYAELQKKLNEATTEEDKERLKAQQILLIKAQEAELNQFNATKNASNPMTDIADRINDVMKALAGINLTDDQIRIVDMLSGVWASMVNPVQTPSPMALPRTTTTTNTTNLNMPIYSNNSPGALQSSMAIAGAALL
jgi:TP901 family phage tail tape measure protein